ncbi:hypothetical protein MJO28_007590 [Puccinia striiformis f. sp. tritici]|uniref:Uncharacterized protein n=1 Tax=Puccinia striiformis f. sp. tritici TaxID=168172 RepID=A0ACC0EF09_9BASI|nr:hypothetical protein MJO28_007590 [Puccinia striiformis f. sp. tritici]
MASAFPNGPRPGGRKVDVPEIPCPECNHHHRPNPLEIDPLSSSLFYHALLFYDAITINE